MHLTVKSLMFSSFSSNFNDLTWNGFTVHQSAPPSQEELSITACSEMVIFVSSDCAPLQVLFYPWPSEDFRIIFKEFLSENVHRFPSVDSFRSAQASWAGAGLIIAVTGCFKERRPWPFLRLSILQGNRHYDIFRRWIILLVVGVRFLPLVQWCFTSAQVGSKWTGSIPPDLFRARWKWPTFRQGGITAIATCRVYIYIIHTRHQLV